MAITAPAPRPPHRVSDGATAEWRSLATLSLAPILSRFWAVKVDARFVLSPHARADGFTHRRERGARPPFTRPCRPFWSAFAGLIRDQTSPTDFCNNDRRASNQTRALASSQGGRPRPPSFSIAPRPLPCGSGGARRAALRPFAMAPVLVPPACAGLPSRDATSSASPPGIAPAVRSEDRRARVEGPSEGRVSDRLTNEPASGAYALLARTPTDRSPPRQPPDIRCRRRACEQRRKPPPTHGPTEAPIPTTLREERRLPEDRDAFHRHDTRRICNARGRIAPSRYAPSRRLSRPRRPHFCPSWGKCS